MTQQAEGTNGHREVVDVKPLVQVPPSFSRVNSFFSTLETIWKVDYADCLADLEILFSNPNFKVSPQDKERARNILALHEASKKEIEKKLGL